MEGRYSTQSGGCAGKNGSPRLNLPQARAYKRFKIGELFDSCVGNADIQKRDLSKTGHLVVSSGIANSGVVGRTHKQARLITKPCLTIDMFGNVFAREIHFVMVTHARVFAVIPKDRSWSFRPLVYVAALLQYFNTIYSFSSMATWGCVRDVEITLPVRDDGKIDLAYMEAYIRELEAARLRELEQYLSSAGFDDCALTQAEQRAVEDWERGKVQLGTFAIGELFDIHPTAAYKLTNHELLATPGRVPLLSNSSQNNGIAAYVGFNATETGNKITFSDTTTSDAIFYQPQDFVGYPHVQGLYARDDKWQEKHLLFLTSEFRVAAMGRFDYATKFTRKIASKMQVVIPITPAEKIDYVFIETFIRGIMKQAISSVIAWMDKEIAATKSVCVPDV